MIATVIAIDLLSNHGAVLLAGEALSKTLAEVEDEVMTLAEVEDEVMTLTEVEDEVMTLTEVEDEVMTLTEVEDEVISTVVAEVREDAEGGG